MLQFHCDWCGKLIDKPLQWVQRTYPHHFCSQACYHQWNAQRRKKRLTRFCLNCGKGFEVIKGHIRGRLQGQFCSATCWGKWNGTHSNPFKGKRHTLQAKEKIGKASRERKAIIKALIGKYSKPNSAEAHLLDILTRHFQKQWRFTGDGQLIISGLIPDFVNTNGKKAVIELYGAYWHSGNRLSSWNRTELGRIMAYNALGFRCLVIWEHELKDERAVVGKVEQFMAQRAAKRRS